MKNNRNIYLVLVSIIFISFFLPWVSVESEAVSGFSKVLTGKKQSVLDTISGYDVPVLANGDESRFMISIIKIFKPDIKDADKKSYLIWLVPFFSLLLFWLKQKFPRNKWVGLGVGLIGALIFVVAVWKITTTDLDKLVLKISIGYGLWLILLAYLGIGILELWAFIKSLKS